MLNKKHLDKTKILKSTYGTRLKKLHIRQIVPLTPKDTGEYLGCLRLFDRIATHSFSLIPGVLESMKDREKTPEEKYYVSLLRRNVNQGNLLKDLYLLKALSSGLARVEAYQTKGKSLYAQISFEGELFISRVKEELRVKHQAPEGDFIAKLPLDRFSSNYVDKEVFVNESAIVRTLYIRLNEALTKHNRKISIHNEIFDQLAPMIKAGQIQLVDTL